MKNKNNFIIEIPKKEWDPFFEYRDGTDALEIKKRIEEEEGEIKNEK